MKKIILIVISIFWMSFLNAQTFDVQHYDINLSVPDSYHKYIEANTLIKIKILQDNISEIELMLLDLAVDSIIINSELQSFTHNDTIINIQLGNTYQTDDVLTLSIYYHGDAHTDSDGWGGYFSKNGYVFNLGVSMSSDPHNYGRVWYPCVDNFTDKATYQFNITCQEARTAICGGTLIDEINNGNGTKTFSWLLNKQTPTYLTSVAIGNYKVYKDTFDGILGKIPVAIYARDSEIDKVPASFLHLRDIFNIYESKFGAYRWSRVGYVGVDFNSGAMEHAENIAYPNNSIDGTTNGETLYGHELAHSWFGNLTTCNSAEDMWLNEGWASYCEAIFTENLYGTEAFKTYNRNRHYKNLQRLHFDEGAYWPIYGIPTDLTYSNHVYNKGADVVHSLREFLGDDLFFSTMTNFLTDYQFQSFSSYDLKDYITTNTPYNLDDFFDSWVFNGGWMHFSVDSFDVTPNASQFDVKVFMRQKLKGKSTYGNNNRIPIQFLSSNFERLDTIITISGETDSQTFTIPFQPYTVICDLEEQLSDATTDQYTIIKNTGLQDYKKELFKTNITEITDSVLFRIEHNWVAPDDFKIKIENLEIHPERYWKVDGIFNNNFKANGQFYYSRSPSAYLDKDFVTTNVDSIVILYRSNINKDWEIIPHTKNGSAYSGYMIIEQIQRGEYAFGIWDHHVNISNKIKPVNIKIYPNPITKGETIQVTMNNQYSSNNFIDIFDATGKNIKQIKIQSQTFQISTENWEKGIYFIKVGQVVEKLIVK